MLSTFVENGFVCFLILLLFLLLLQQPPLVVVVVVVVDNRANFGNLKGTDSNCRFSHVRREMNLFLVPINQKQ